MQLYLIRHAQSVNNALWDRTGSNVYRVFDPPLTELGQRQADLLGQWLSDSTDQSASRGIDSGEPNLVADHDWYDLHNRSGYQFTHLYSSLMIRAVQTSSAIARKLNLPINAWVDWHEGGGLYLEEGEDGEKSTYPGYGRSHFADHYPELILPDSLDDTGWWHKRPYEDRPERWQRAARVLADLKLRHHNTPHRVAVITHGGFYNYFLKTILGIDTMEGFWFLMNNAAISRIDFEDNEVRLVYANRADYLPTEWIT